jgi:hypothetical protein
VKIALYKGKKTITDKLISWWDRGLYSHVELVFSDGLCASSSPRDGGVRMKPIELWVCVPRPTRQDEVVLQRVCFGGARLQRHMAFYAEHSSNFIYRWNLQMTEPTTATAAGVAAWATSASAITLAVFGVDYYALLWGFVGALFARGHAESMTKIRAALYIALSTAVHTSRPILIVLCVACGAGAQRLLDAVVAALESKIKSVGGSEK